MNPSKTLLERSSSSFVVEFPVLWDKIELEEKEQRKKRRKKEEAEDSPSKVHVISMSLSFLYTILLLFLVSFLSIICCLNVITRDCMLSC